MNSSEHSAEATAAIAAFDAAAMMYLTQSKLVAKLRCDSLGTDELLSAETLLREHKRLIDAARKQKEAIIGPSNDTSSFNRVGTDRVLKRRFFIAPSFEIYGGVSGLYDYGPPGCAVKNNVLAVWKQHYVVEESMLELEASCLTPAPVLKASGHVDKFSDLMVKDVETGEGHRADHLLRDHLNVLIDESKDLEEKNAMIGLRERLDELTQEEMDANLSKYGAMAPKTGNALTNAYPFNLMFQTSIGPSGLMPGYLRPETAQGIFVNFKRLLEQVGGKLPFACAQIGLAFRNEISPKAGLLRVREFQQAEIEHFVNADDKSHPKFNSVADVVINMYGRAQQMEPPYEPVKMQVGKAVAQGLIGNETLGYFIGRTSRFVERIGMNMDHVRFRQHLEHEMAHYASDCWDLEINCSYGWVECAGLADRSAYDLGNHSEKSGIELTAREIFPEPRNVEALVAIPNKGALGKKFKRDAQGIMKEIEAMDENGVKALKTSIEGAGNAVVAGFEIGADHVGFKLEKKTLTGRNYYPSVIEPSFGVGRILSCLWEHVFYLRSDDDEARGVLALPGEIAPVKCVILPLSKSEAFNKMLQKLQIEFGKNGLVVRVDDSGGSIGKRYSRSDEIGTPLGVTVDLKSLEDGSVTLRERDSMEQVRLASEEVVAVVKKFVAGLIGWAGVKDMYPLFTS